MRLKIMIYDRNKIPLGFLFFSSENMQPIFSLWKTKNAEYFKVMLEGDTSDPTLPSQL